MLKSIDSPRAIFCGDSELYLITVELEDKPGTLLEVLAVLASYGLNLVSIYSTETRYARDRGPVEVNLIVDLTDKRVSIEQLVKSISLLNVVKDVKYISKQLPNMLVDEIHFPLLVMGDRAVIYREGAYREMILGIRRQLGTAGEALLYHIGYNIGKGAWEKIKQVCGEKYEFLPLYVKYWMLVHGAANVLEAKIDIAKKDFLIRAENVYECVVGLGYGKPFSNLFRGSLAGLLHEVLNIETVVETKCIAAGDPYCEFAPVKK